MWPPLAKLSEKWIIHIVRADPQIAVARLRHAANGVLRQAVLLRPNLVRVLRQAFMWVQRPGGVERKAREDYGSFHSLLQYSYGTWAMSYELRDKQIGSGFSHFALR